MTIDQAHHLLGLTPGADLGTLGQAYADKKADLAVRLASAPTPGLKDKLEQQVKQLDEAYRTASHALAHPANLPRTAPPLIPPAATEEAPPFDWEEKYKALEKRLQQHETGRTREGTWIQQQAGWVLAYSRSFGITLAKLFHRLFGRMGSEYVPPIISPANDRPAPIPPAEAASSVLTKASLGDTETLVDRSTDQRRLEEKGRLNVGAAERSNLRPGESDSSLSSHAAHQTVAPRSIVPKRGRAFLTMAVFAVAAGLAAWYFTVAGPGSTHRRAKASREKRSSPEITEAVKRQEEAELADTRAEAIEAQNVRLSIPLKSRLVPTWDYCSPGAMNGFVDDRGKIVIETTWDRVEAFPKGEKLSRVMRGGKFGFIDRNGKVVIKPEWDGAERFLNGRALTRVERGRKYGFIDRTGRVVIEPEWEAANSFDKGEALTKVKRGGKWGFVDRAGKVVVEAVWDSAESFSKEEGLAGVKRGESWGFIDRTGKVVIEPSWDMEGSFHEGLINVKRGGKWGFIDRTGKIVIEPAWDKAFSFHGGLANVSRGEKWGWIDHSGKIVIEPTWDFSLLFVDGLAQVQRDHLYGFIDPTGKVVIQPKWSDAHAFTEGLAAVKDPQWSRWGFIDGSGKPVISCKWAEVNQFSGGLARVRESDGGSSLKRKYGFINHAGQVIIENSWAYAEQYEAEDGKTYFFVGRLLNSDEKEGLAETAWLDIEGKEIWHSSTTTPTVLEQPRSDPEQLRAKGEKLFHEGGYFAAAQFFESAADKGDGISQWFLGLLYKNGTGRTRDLVKAVAWFEKAAAQGKPYGQTALGRMYRDGMGVSKDFGKAAELFQKASDLGDDEARNDLGLMYESGNGVPKDLSRAVQLFQKAASNGNASAKENLQRLGR